MHIIHKIISFTLGIVKPPLVHCTLDVMVIVLKLTHSVALFFYSVGIIIVPKNGIIFAAVFWLLYISCIFPFFRSSWQIQQVLQSVLFSYVFGCFTQ